MMAVTRRSTAEQRASLASSLVGRDSVFRRRNSEEDDGFEEKLWRWSYLQEQFRENPLHDLFKLYTLKIHHGYFSLFLILLFVISLSHFLVVLIESLKKMDGMNAVILDLTLYITVGLLSLIGLFLSEKYIWRRQVPEIDTPPSEKHNVIHKEMLKKASVFAFLVLFLVDILVPIYHFLVTMDDPSTETRQYRPAYTTYHIIACYIFLNVSTNLIAVVLGVFISVVHIVILILITYGLGSEDLAYRITSHVTYLICVNGLGLYIRVMTEIMKRRSFLDRRKCVESTLRLKYEKAQEEQLMSSIIPEHIIKNVRSDVREKINRLENNQKLQNKNPFENKFIETFDNVTILYADIKNYTHLTTTLKSIKLVETLDELFSRFDDASEDLRVMRIKFLGDCYYCVAGLPPNRITNHADACVELGLKMIKIIRNIREKFNLNIDMRIGIHTGSVSSGIIGETKWQYDIWSEDAYIANEMETTGVPGKVHITQKTKDQLLNTYKIEPSDTGKGSRYMDQTYLVSEETLPEKSYLETIGELNTQAELIKSRNSKTYKILGNQTPPEPSNRPRNSIYQRNQLNGVINHQAKRSEYKRRTAFMEHILKYHERLKNTNTHMEQAIETMPLSKYDQWFKVEEIHPLWLVFRNYNTEKDFVKQPDPLFKYYILSEIIILVCLIIIQNIPTPRSYAWWGYMLLALITAILIPISWTHYLWHSLKYEADKPKPCVINFLYNTSQVVTQSVTLRTIIFLILSVLFGATVLIALTECENFDINRTRFEAHSFGIFSILFRSSLQGDNEDTCILPWHMTETCALTIIMSFLFLRIHIFLKLIFAVLVTGIYSYFLWIVENFKTSETYNPNMDARIAHILSIVYLTFTLHFIDRQMDYLNRLDHKWNIQLTEEEEEAREMRMLNSILLNNILPTHVADYFLDPSRKSGPYYEEYTEESPVAVMFASLTDYLEISENNSLNVMNDIICKFDQLLLAKYEDIEKIKVANWTYMVACGLDQGRTTVVNEEQHNSKERKMHAVISILKFAVDLFPMLQEAQRASQQQCKLKIGISHGEVTAGVVGSKKPLYDIWGDAVNMASRMDSTGVKCKIQVTKNTADIIMEYGYSCTFRGNISVKGKDTLVPTFFVDLDENGQLMKK